MGEETREQLKALEEKLEKVEDETSKTTRMALFVQLLRDYKWPIIIVVILVALVGAGATPADIIAYVKELVAAAAGALK